MKFSTLAKARRDTGLSYIGSVNSSSKIAKNGKLGTMTYIIYLAPAKMSGYEVCPMRTIGCTAACLNESGHNRIDTTGRINRSRIAKTKLFFEHREFFMQWVVAEISAAKRKADKKGMAFSVRLNGTSDIEPKLFRLNGELIFDIFKDVQFYDYTKVKKRMFYKIPNYDLTFSFSGTNMLDCVDILINEGRVSMVFEKKLPVKFMGFPVFNGDETDLRYLEPSGIVGLKFKRVRKKINVSDNDFIISSDNHLCEF